MTEHEELLKLRELVEKQQKELAKELAHEQEKITVMPTIDLERVPRCAFLGRCLPGVARERHGRCPFLHRPGKVHTG